MLPVAFIIIIALIALIALIIFYGVITMPVNGVYAGGKDPLVEEFVVETAAFCYPGRLVKKDTNVNDIEVCGATDDPLGWLGYEHANPVYQPATRDTLYTATHRAPVLSGGGFYIRASLLNGVGAVTKGTRLYAAANGEVTTGAALSIDSGTTAVLSTAANGPIISGELTDKICVGTCQEDADSTSSAVPILVKSRI